MKYYLLAAAAALSISSAATAQTTMSLNTGYNYGTFNLYAQPVGMGPSAIRDNYWIKIATNDPSPPVGPAWVYNPAVVAPWSTLPGARWVGPAPTPTTGFPASASNPAFYIYRKCFCLMPGYQNPTLRFQLRADNESNAFLNSITNVLVPPSPSSFAGAPITSNPTNPGMFRTGLNCVYVLVQNTGGPTGFNLAGTVTATGLMPNAGAGANNSFAPCQCGGPGARGLRAADASDDRATIRAIVAYAEAQRRRAATAQ